MTEIQNMYLSPEWRVLLNGDHLVDNYKSIIGYEKQQHKTFRILNKTLNLQSLKYTHPFFF